ncbi:MAG: pknB 21 [Edaphobacter sp.]|nr:pknB 21 [Edaphobacter sp.]
MLDEKTGNFDTDLPTPAGGFYAVEVRLKDESHLLAQITVPHVAVGEVFIISGQSNATNYGEVPQITETGMVTTFSGDSWRLANDPSPEHRTAAAKAASLHPSAMLFTADTECLSVLPPSATAPPACVSGYPPGNQSRSCLR